MPKQRDSLHSRGKALEEMFFRRKDNVLMESKRQLEKTERSIKSVAEISGIRDQAILRRLIEMNVQVEVMATLSVIPLIEIAWADGKVSEKEREAILHGAERFGLKPGGIDYVLLEEWLRQPPPEGLLESWLFYMQGLCELLTESERLVLKKEFLERAKAVAESTGGRFGSKGKVSLRESDILLKIESAFGA